MLVAEGKYAKDAGLGGSALTEVQRASRKAGIVLFSARVIRVLERYIVFALSPLCQVQVRAHIFLQSVNVIRNMDYLARCIKTEAQSAERYRVHIHRLIASVVEIDVFARNPIKWSNKCIRTPNRNMIIYIYR